jgi:DTW domain-containing protein YfiP
MAEHPSTASNARASKLVNFETDHHEMNRRSFAIKTAWWQEQTATGFRCPVCWLRHYECFCEAINARRQHYNAPEYALQHVQVLMYYHYQELGRSANTAHLLEALCPPAAFEKIVYGDTVAEQRLVAEMHAEALRGEQRTVVLYPSADAILLSDWMKTHRPPPSSSSSPLPVRLVALDGTYAQASRQWKFLQKSLALLSTPPHSCPSAPSSSSSSSILPSLPVVKLDLEAGQCHSALAGIMHQPGKEKICTYQACVMAMRQAGERGDTCDALGADLDAFLQHILKVGASTFFARCSRS